MPRIILLLLLLGAAIYLVYWFRGLSEDKKKQVAKRVAVAGLLILLAIMALTGRLHWIAAAIGALLPLLPRLARFAFGVWPAVLPYFRRYQQNKQSSMRTHFLSLQINMITGELQGEVLDGKYKGEKLQLMTVEQLNELLSEYQGKDAESAALLSAFMQRKHPGSSSSSGDSSSYSPGDSSMSEQQARDVLGLSEKATKADVIKAHKRLMQKLHPDRGGSDYLAVQINQAKEVLLKLL